MNHQPYVQHGDRTSRMLGLEAPVVVGDEMPSRKQQRGVWRRGWISSCPVQALKFWARVQRLNVVGGVEYVE